MREGLDQLESLLKTLDTGGAAGPRQRPERYYQLLVDVYERGRHGPDADSFAALGRNRGYDARGLGGFFVGARAPLRRIEGQVTLTVEGHRLLDAHLTGPVR